MADNAGKSVAQVVGAAGHLAVGIFYLAVGLVVPGPVIPFFWAIWLLLAVLLLRHRHDPRWALGIPVVAAVALVVAVSVGEAVFGWTA